MIGKLKGLIDGYGDDYVHLDVNGVVYEAFCSSKTMAALPQVGHAAVVHVEMIVREDMIRLYGFATPEEKAWFTTLMTVQGVGARVALSVLSTLSAGELQTAIALQDKAMVGRAVTSLARKAAPEAATPALSTKHSVEMIDEAKPGEVGVIVMEGTLDIAAMGNLMATAASVRGMASSLVTL